MEQRRCLHSALDNHILEVDNREASPQALLPLAEADTLEAIPQAEPSLVASDGHSQVVDNREAIQQEPEPNRWWAAGANGRDWYYQRRVLVRS